MTQATRITDDSSNILDLVLTTHADNFSSVTCLRGLSDHMTVHTTHSCDITKSKKTKKILTLYDKGDYDSINEGLTTFFDSVSTGFRQRSLESNWLLYKTELQRLVQLYIPNITITERAGSPWFNASLKRLNNKKKRLFRAAKRSNCSYTWEKYYSAAKVFDALMQPTKRNFDSTTLPSMLLENYIALLENYKSQSI